ncbi:YicC family protein [Candidatus Desulfarcum epimagneticum]|uniref:YicC family protein n=1 Tax=uncultured Desulfobacteraceae bacterium TaxID=218296 RepID=A0A484HH71_9BACT|nr:YicC family protein [uncultured Desulfobacteraceae bacterium]
MTMSMTAFARAETVSGGVALSVEIRSVNGRNFDLSLRLPRELSGLEEWIRKAISKKASRGRVEASLALEDVRGETDRLEIDAPRARAVHRACLELKALLGLEDDITLDLILKTDLILKNGHVIRPAEPEIDMDAFEKDARACVERALADFAAMRRTEGECVRRDFLERLEGVESRMEAIGRESAAMLPHYRKRLERRVSSLAGGLVEIDPGRICQEAAFLADKSDISEEITRIQSHIEQFREILNAEGASGRKLNFLVQELGREINTIASKTGSLEASRTAVEVKSELEKIREQVQNVE